MHINFILSKLSSSLLLGVVILVAIGVFFIGSEKLIYAATTGEINISNDKKTLEVKNLPLNLVYDLSGLGDLISKNYKGTYNAVEVDENDPRGKILQYRKYVMADDEWTCTAGSRADSNQEQPYFLITLSRKGDTVATSFKVGFADTLDKLDKGQVGDDGYPKCSIKPKPIDFTDTQMPTSTNLKVGNKDKIPNNDDYTGTLGDDPNGNENTDAVDESDDEQEPPEDVCDFKGSWLKLSTFAPSAFDWFGCTVIQGLNSVIKSASSGISAMLETDESSLTKNQLKSASRPFLNIANVLFLLAFLFIIISQGIIGKF